jgi:drug/metabolite transporter (DMT)-like permease
MTIPEDTARPSGRTARGRRPPAILGGVVLAALAAIAFGVTTPIVAWAGRGIGAFTTAALLYLGAAGSALLLGLRGRGGEARVRRADAPRLLLVALFGGAIAPTLLAWGLQRSGPTLGALLLNLEAVFTVLLARAVYREPIGARVAVAVAAMAAGGAALTLDAWRATSWGILGLAAVAAATAAWALDNTLTRPLAERDPLEVVAAKGLLGGATTLIAALAAGDPMPGGAALAALLVCGASGYGLSLRLYLLAQRRIGAGRTGSVFALAPFVGAALAFALGDRTAGPFTLLATALFGFGVYLHATERHGHWHVHDPVSHDHPHRHDDGHHHHHHEPPVLGEHSHAHTHDHMEHEHEHAPDIHHEHRHS